MPSAPSPIPRRLAVAALGSLLCAGCLGGQTGGEHVPEGTAAGAPCAEIATELAFDEQSPLGVSAREALDGVLGTSTSLLSWSADTAPVSVGPEQGQSSIRIDLEYRGRRVVWMDGQQPQSDSNPTGATSAAAAICPDRLEVDVVAHIATERGALDEEIEVTLVVPAAGQAGFFENLALSELAGSLSVSTPDGVSAPLITIRADWGATGFYGAIDGRVTVAADQRGATAASPRVIQYALWPPPGAP